MKGRIKVAALFAGCGGDSLGFLNANTLVIVRLVKALRLSMQTIRMKLHVILLRRFLVKRWFIGAMSRKKMTLGPQM